MPSQDTGISPLAESTELEVLIIDDNDQDSESLERVLKPLGLTVTRESERYLAEEHVRYSQSKLLLIIDWRLGADDGIELFRAIEDYPNVIGTILVTHAFDLLLTRDVPQGPKVVPLDKLSSSFDNDVCRVVQSFKIMLLNSLTDGRAETDPREGGTFADSGLPMQFGSAGAEQTVGAEVYQLASQEILRDLNQLDLQLGDLLEDGFTVGEAISALQHETNANIELAIRLVRRRIHSWRLAARAERIVNDPSNSSAADMDRTRLKLRNALRATADASPISNFAARPEVSVATDSGRVSVSSRLLRVLGRAASKLRRRE